MSTIAEQIAHSPEELLRLPDWPRFELINGELIERPLLGARASLTAGRLILLIGQFVDAYKLGLIFGGKCGYQIFKDDPTGVRFPDVSFIGGSRLPSNQVPSGHMRIAPDLAVHVVSPGDIAEHMEARLSDYLSAGIRLIWLIYPETRSVWVVRQAGSPARLGAQDELTGDDVLPGFTCRVEALFQQ